MIDNKVNNLINFNRAPKEDGWSRRKNRAELQGATFKYLDLMVEPGERDTPCIEFNNERCLSHSQINYDM